MDGTIADPGVAAVPGRGSLVTRRLVTRSTPSSAESGAANTGQAASKRRDLLFRRALLVADALAVIGAFVLTMELSSRSVQLTWASIAALPILLVGAKISGLYDRDDTLLRKTTLDEAPKLFQVATLCALVAWLTGGLIVAGTLDRREALFLWLALAALLMLMRTAARAIALRIAPEERCLFIGDAAGAKTIRSKLSDHGGIRASMVAELDLDKSAPWSTDARSASKLAEVRALARSLGDYPLTVGMSCGILDLCLILGVWS